MSDEKKRAILEDILVAERLARLRQAAAREAEWMRALGIQSVGGADPKETRE